MPATSHATLEGQALPARSISEGDSCQVFSELPLKPHLLVAVELPAPFFLQALEFADRNPKEWRSYADFSRDEAEAVGAVEITLPTRPHQSRHEQEELYLTRELRQDNSLCGLRS